MKPGCRCVYKYQEGERGYQIYLLIIKSSSYAVKTFRFDPRRRYRTRDYFKSNVQGYLEATDIRLRLEYPGTDGREYINEEAILNQVTFFYLTVAEAVETIF